MSEKKQCPNCGRNIDAAARMCLYCNWDQSETPKPKPLPAEIPAADVAPAYVPPAEHRWRTPLLIAIGIAALLVCAFVVGSFIHGFEPDDIKQTAQTTTHPPIGAPPPTQAPRGDVTLVPVAGGNEQPITSAPAPAPAQGVPNEYQRNDATALPTDQYAQAATRAKSETQTAPQPIVDPRSLGGPAYSQQQPGMASSATPPPMRKPAPEAVRVARRTDPVPEYQPIPQIHVDRDVTARIDLTIGADGRVTDVAFDQPIAGEMPKLISAIQSWRFRPATEDGAPVPSHFRVDISFHPDE